MSIDNYVERIGTSVGRMLDLWEALPMIAERRSMPWLVVFRWASLPWLMIAFCSVFLLKLASVACFLTVSACDWVAIKPAAAAYRLGRRNRKSDDVTKTAKAAKAPAHDDEVEP